MYEYRKKGSYKLEIFIVNPFISCSITILSKRIRFKVNLADFLVESCVFYSDWKNRKLCIIRVGEYKIEYK